MSWWSFITNGGKAVEKAIDNAGSVFKSGMTLIDEAFDTPDEKREFKLSLMTQYKDALGMIYDNNSIRSATRREIAMLVTKSFFLSGWLSVSAKLAGYIEAGDILWAWVTMQSTLMLTVMGFYFTLYCLDKGTDIAKNVFGNKKSS